MLIPIMVEGDEKMRSRSGIHDTLKTMIAEKYDPVCASLMSVSQYVLIIVRSSSLDSDMSSRNSYYNCTVLSVVIMML